MTKKEKSAIDTVYDIFDYLKELDKRLTIIDNNIKLLNNKINKISQNGDKNMPPGAVESPSAIAPIAIVQPKENILSTENIKVFGRIKNKQAKPIKDIDVRIYDKIGNNIKSRVTDSEGYWEARIPPGVYGVEYDPSNVNKRLKPVNFKVTVSPGIKELDISEVNK